VVSSVDIRDKPAILRLGRRFLYEASTVSLCSVGCARIEYGTREQQPRPRKTIMNTAVFSACEGYRYHLFRAVSDSPRQVAFVLLNPSTATADSDDPTIGRCIGFAKLWGFGGLHHRYERRAA
jgi:Protein of unknown function (DUF1643)